MDANKLSKLHEINYTIKKCCGICAHSAFSDRDPSLFATCVMFYYDHEKHSNALRNLSVTRYGYCDSFKQSRYLETRLDKFFKFVEE